MCVSLACLLPTYPYLWGTREAYLLPKPSGPSPATELHPGLSSGGLHSTSYSASIPTLPLSSSVALSQTKCLALFTQQWGSCPAPEAALYPQGAWCTGSKPISRNQAVPISLVSVLLHHEFLEDRDHMATPVLRTGNNSELILLVHYDQLKQAYNCLLPS